MNVQVGSSPSIYVVCDTPLLTAGVPSYGVPLSYLIVQNNSSNAGIGGLVPVAAIANGPPAALITTLAGDWPAVGPFALFVTDAASETIGVVYGNIVSYAPAAFAVLAAAQPNYAPSKAGDQMDLVNAPNATAGAALAADLLDLANAVETGLTVRQALRLLDAVLAGKVSISGATVTIRNTADTKNRVVATTDTQGQRTAVTIDVS
jgi:hypothetical protein